MKQPLIGRVILLMLTSLSATAFGWIGNSANDATYSSENGYVQLKGEDKDNAGQNSWVGGFGWVGNVVPDGSRDFYVPHKGNTIFMKHVTSKDAAVPFPGRTLVVASQIYYLGALGGWGNLGDNVTMLGGSRFFWNSVGSITGTSISLANCNETWPVIFGINGRANDRYSVTMDAAVKADPEAHLVWQTFGAGNVGVTYTLRSSWPEFYGTLNLHSNNIFQASTFSMPGCLHVVDESTAFALTASSGTSVFGGLSVEPGADFRLTTAGNTHLVAVTGKLDLAEGAVVRGGKFSRWSNGTPPTNQVFSLSPEAVAAGVPNMTKVKYDLTGCANALAFADFPTVSWTSTPRDDGGVYLGVTYKEVVSITNNMLDTATPFYEDGSEANAPSRFMSDGLAFHKGADYYAQNKNLILKSLEYPYVFKGDSLVLASFSSIGFYGSFTCTNLVLVNNGYFRCMDEGRTYEVDGSMRVCRNPGNPSLPAWCFKIGNRGTYKVSSSISGDGDILARLEPRTQTNLRNWCGYMELLGDNFGYTGRIILEAGKAGDFSSADAFKDREPYAPGPVSNVTLTVHQQANLGGPLSKFTPDSLCVSNECRVVLADTAVFNEPTRGWCFPENGYLKVESGATATVKNVITYGTRLVKEGEGSLILGSAPLRFDGSVRPELVVQDGGLGVAASDALAGLDVTFAAGTTFVVSADLDDDAMPAGGADLTDTGVTAPEGVNVVVEMSATPTARMDVPIATVTAAGAEALEAKLNVKRVSRCKTVLAKTVNGDGTVTFMARVSPAGLCISVK